NIMLGSHGELYLLDWGCARKAGEHWKAVQGTPRYLPPEAYKTRVVDPKTDIFALGVILYEIFTLRKGGCRHASDKKLAGIEDVHALTSYRHFQNGVALDRRFTAIVRKAVDVDVARRYADVASLQSDVRRFMMGESISATHFSISELFGRFLFRNPFVIVLFVLSFLACMMGMRVYYQFQVVDAENSASAELLQLSELQSDISVLATHVDMNYLQSRFRLSLMSSALFEVLRTHPGELLEQYSNEDYREGESSTVDVQYFPGFREPVSMTHAVRHGALPKRQKVKFCEQCFAKIAKNVIFSEEEQIDQSEFLTETGFERIFFENQDGTRYSYPGRYENEEAENYRNRWQTYSDVTKGNPGTMVFQENGIWLATFSAPILDENARHKGKVSAEFRLDFLYRDVVEESKKWPDRKFYIIGSPFDKILIQDGNILRGTSDGGCSEAVLSAQMQEVKQDRFAVKTFTDAGVHWALSGAPIEHVGGHMLFQLVSLGKADVHPQGTQNE
ncbi:MAG: protein kinase, partial [Clostridia bacterium]|nr:protein kinase [Clostridia bacterium]